MKHVQILYFEGCPNHGPTVDLAKQVIDELAVEAQVEEREVKPSDDAEALRFLGSPTVLVDGVDIEPAARERTDFGFSCRTYPGGGMPARDLLAAALTDRQPSGVEEAEASPGSSDCCGPQQSSASEQQRRGYARDMLASPLAVGFAVAGSACCWLPLMFVAFGVSAGGLGAAFHAWRPYLLIASGAALAVGFYTAYSRAPQRSQGAACSIREKRLARFSRGMLWAATALVAAFGLFPYYSGTFVQNQARAATVTDESASITIGVGDMTCQACAVHLQRELEKVEGVEAAQVDYESGAATVTRHPTSPASRAVLKNVIENTGYTVRAPE